MMMKLVSAVTRVLAMARPSIEAKLSESASGLLRPSALERWNAGIKAAPSAAAADNVIRIFGVIGEDWWTGEGTTSSSVSERLAEIGIDQDVEVHINSPGGDMFEGISIYNLLKAHGGKVTVKVFGLAASAASVIAMAGEEVLIGRGAFLMIHNCWVVAIGNRHDMREVADYLEPFDSSLGDIYAARSGADKADIAKWMDAETFFGAQEAIDKGLADGMLGDEDVVEEATDTKSKALKASYRLDAALQKDGMSRSERRALIKDLIGGKPSAADGSRAGKPGAAGKQDATLRAGESGWTGAATKAALDLLQTLRS